MILLPGRYLNEMLPFLSKSFIYTYLFSKLLCTKNNSSPFYKKKFNDLSISKSYYFEVNRLLGDIFYNFNYFNFEFLSYIDMSTDSRIFSSFKTKFLSLKFILSVS